jgi:hypothetical protein
MSDIHIGVDIIFWALCFFAGMVAGAMIAYPLFAVAYVVAVLGCQAVWRAR